MTRKPYDDANTELLFLSYKEWCLERDFAVDEAIFEQLADFVHAHGGFEPPMSLWDRAAVELNVKPRKLARPIEIDQAFRDEVRSIPSSELLKRINRDATFKAKFDALAAEDTAAGVRAQAVEPEVTLTRQQYFSIPAATLAQRYAASPAFRHAVDVLIARGEI